MKKVIIIFISSIFLCVCCKQRDQDFLSHYNEGVYKQIHLNDYRGAILNYDKAIEINPEFRSAYYNRGVCKISIGQIDSGCLDLSKAGELSKPGDKFRNIIYDDIRKYCTNISY